MPTAEWWKLLRPRSTAGGVHLHSRPHQQLVPPAMRQGSLEALAKNFLVTPAQRFSDPINRSVLAFVICADEELGQQAEAEQLNAG